MPLIIFCKKCRVVMYRTSGRVENRYRSSRQYSNLFDLSIPDILDRKLHFKCPKCGREITEEDFQIALKNLKIFDARKYPQSRDPLISTGELEGTP